MRLLTSMVVLAMSAGGCASPGGESAPATGTAKAGTELRAELDGASCAELRDVMGRALGERDGAPEDATTGEAAAPTGVASMFLILPGPRTLNRLFSGDADEDAADPETVYRIAHETYEARDCQPKLPFGES